MASRDVRRQEGGEPAERSGGRRHVRLDAFKLGPSERPCSAEARRYAE